MWVMTRAEAHGYYRAAATRRQFGPFVWGFRKQSSKTHIALIKMWVMTRAPAHGEGPEKRPRVAAATLEMNGVHFAF